MVTAIVMIKTDVDRIPEVAQEVSGLDGVSEAYSVTGEWNLIAIVRVRAHEELAEVIPGRLNKVPGIVRTETHIAFQAYSSHDLEAAFALGLE
jgi:DNA-binding Lrp family transcriptional regulator